MRLEDGQSGPGYEYGRLEFLRWGFWGNVCGVLGFPPESAKVACFLLGYDGGAPLRFPVPYQGERVNQVLKPNYFKKASMISLFSCGLPVAAVLWIEGCVLGKKSVIRSLTGAVSASGVSIRPVHAAWGSGLQP